LSSINHIGLIPDGNRRWALKNSLDYKTAYMKSMVHIVNCIGWIFDMNFESISIYLLSNENLKREREDIDSVIYAEEYLLSDILYPVCQQYSCKVIHAGNRDLLPYSMKIKIDYLCSITRDYKERTLFLLIGYNPIDEINTTINQNGFIEMSLLSVPKKVDVVIRTAGGASLLSNFLPIQCGYAQIYMVDALFNDLTRQEIEAILNTASQVKMQYGK